MAIAPSMRVAVVIATTGRRDTLERTAPHWASQSSGYDRFIISVPSNEDVGPIAAGLPHAEIVLGPKGSTRQRNTALDHLGLDCDLVLYADDDFVPSKYYIEAVRQIMTAEPDIVMLSGVVLVDGINTQGVSYEDAIKIVAEYDAKPRPSPPAMMPMPHGYGCNMVARISADPTLRFDARLPSYAWLEDLDYSRRLAPRGRLIRTDLSCGVHMGTKRGRTSGVKLGYSQVANPAYFVGKGTMSFGEALTQVSRNVLANLFKSISPEPWVDRLGRFRGNCLAIGDIAIGRVRPERIDEL